METHLQEMTYLDSNIVFSCFRLVDHRDIPSLPPVKYKQMCILFSIELYSRKGKSDDVFSARRMETHTGAQRSEGAPHLGLALLEHLRELSQQGPDE